jgi:hypothetical protein
MGFGVFTRPEIVLGRPLSSVLWFKSMKLKSENVIKYYPARAKMFNCRTGVAHY